ncbi:MAG: DUF4250 domain-containing protein [Coprococcus sp.]|nr:DUF4250 domain-containing protein [Coprococcus sp.]
MMEGLPKDPILLLSVVNTKLRDFYPGLNELCRDLGVDKHELEKKLETAGYAYESSVNQFI